MNPLYDPMQDPTSFVSVYDLYYQNPMYMSYSPAYELFYLNAFHTTYSGVWDL